MKSLHVLALLLPTLALAAPLGIEPGSTTKDEIIKKYGEPSKILVGKDGKEVIGYFGAKAPKNDKGVTLAQQAQFRVDPKTGVVERIDIFPATALSKAEVIKKYGQECPEGILPEQSCYVKKVTEDLRAYFFYPRAGVAVFFKPDGDTVHTLVFTALKK